MKGFDCGGSDFGFVDGGSVTSDRSFQTWNPSVQDGQFTLGSGGNVALHRQRRRRSHAVGAAAASLTERSPTAASAAAATASLTLKSAAAASLTAAWTPAAEIFLRATPPARLTVTSNFTQQAGNTLRVEIAGRQPGHYEQMHAGGSTVQEPTRPAISQSIGETFID
jgi:hypothetical protein